jgi:hypothetical protein
MANPTTARGGTEAVTRELPAPGYPASEEAIENWFHDRYGRAPTERELGAIIGEMAQREATAPNRGPDAVPQGWVIGPETPATRR